MRNVLHQGAESKIYVEEFLGRQMLVKERFEKKYRNPELDAILTRDRIKAECRNIVRCKQAGIKTPAVYYVDFEQRQIYMEYFDTAVTVKQYIQKIESGNSNPASLHRLAMTIGETLSKMHSANVVHGDLTTSNLLLLSGKGTIDDIIVIDFGLSHSDVTFIDKAVDLYVLEKALSSTHADTEFFSVLLKAYSDTCSKGAREVLSKLEDIRAQGRKRTMVG